MTEHPPPRARQRLLLGLLAAVLALSGCAGDGGDEVDTAPAARQASGGEAVLDVGRLPAPTPARYGPGYWTEERLAKLEAAKAAGLREARARATASPAATPPPVPSPTPSPSQSPSPVPQEPSPSPTPTQGEPPVEEPSEPSEPTEPTEPEEPVDDDSLIFTSWGCQWSHDSDGLRGAACSGEFGQDDASEWSCFEVRSLDDPDGAEQHCSGHVAGQDLAWTCTWEHGSVCALDDVATSWSCMWGGSWGECTDDEAEDGNEPEGWFCADLRDPSEGNWFVCDGAVRPDLPMSALALTGLWPLPD